jgi:hypothetical protein
MLFGLCCNSSLRQVGRIRRDNRLFFTEIDIPEENPEEEKEIRDYYDFLHSIQNGQD